MKEGQVGPQSCILILVFYLDFHWGCDFFPLRYPEKQKSILKLIHESCRTGFLKSHISPCVRSVLHSVSADRAVSSNHHSTRTAFNDPGSRGVRVWARRKCSGAGLGLLYPMEDIGSLHGRKLRSSSTGTTVTCTIITEMQIGNS